MLSNIRIGMLCLFCLFLSENVGQKSVIESWTLDANNAYKNVDISWGLWQESFRSKWELWLYLYCTKHSRLNINVTLIQNQRRDRTTLWPNNTSKHNIVLNENTLWCHTPNDKTLWQIINTYTGKLNWLIHNCTPDSQTPEKDGLERNKQDLSFGIARLTMETRIKMKNLQH